jgi:hypothetical protein
MAERYDGDGFTITDFRRRYLQEWELRALYDVGYMVTSDIRFPGTWRFIACGIPIPLEPHSMARVVMIHQHFYCEITSMQCEDPI